MVRKRMFISLLLIFSIFLILSCDTVDRDPLEEHLYYILTLEIIGEGAVEGLDEGENRISKEGPTLFDLEAIPEDDWDFCFWEGDVGEIFSRETSISLDKNQTLKVYFTDLLVSEDHAYQTIQSAINAANDGDVVLVYPGERREMLNFRGKTIVLQSQNPGDIETIEKTIITHDTGPIITLKDIENNPIIRGFTFRGGDSMNGGAIHIDNSSPTISHSIFENNQATYGGAIYVFYGEETVITENTFKDNSALEHGGALSIRYSPRTSITHNVFLQNTANEGGAVHISSSDKCILYENTFEENEAQSNGGALRIFSSKDIEIKSSTIKKNRAEINGGGLHLQRAEVDITLTNIRENTSLQDGAGLYLMLSSAPKVYNNSIALNTAGGMGGGIFVCATSNILDEDGVEWLKENSPPAAERNNDYFENNHGSNSSEGKNVYFE